MNNTDLDTDDDTQKEPEIVQQRQFLSKPPQLVKKESLEDINARRQKMSAVEVWLMTSNAKSTLATLTGTVQHNTV